jgi:hypothetical protein
MNSSIYTISKYIVRVTLLLGSALLLVGILLVSLQPPGEYVSAQGQGNCDMGWVEKANSPNNQGVFLYNGQETIIKVFIKSGQECIPFTYPPSRQNDGCYQVNGLGTSFVTVFKIGPDTPECQDVSHVEFYAGVVPTETNTPTPTNTATNTPIPTDTATPTSTSTETPLPTDTPTPTNTATNTSTPVATDPIVTITPTDTPVTPPPTDAPPTSTPTETAPTSSPTTPPTAPRPTTPPGTATPQVLIPVTGADLSISGSGSVNNFWLFIYFGIGLLGVWMIFYGIATYYKRNKPS